MKNKLNLILSFFFFVILVPSVSFAAESSISLNKADSKTLYKMLTKEKIGEFYNGNNDQEGPHINVHTVVCSGASEQASCSLVDASFFGVPNKVIEGEAADKLVSFLRAHIEESSGKDSVSLFEPLRVNEISCSAKPQHHCTLTPHPR